MKDDAVLTRLGLSTSLGKFARDGIASIQKLVRRAESELLNAGLTVREMASVQSLQSFRTHHRVFTAEVFDVIDAGLPPEYIATMR